MYAAPYKSAFDHLLASAGSFLLTILFGCSYAFKNAALVGLAEIQDKMSNEQKALYIVSQDTLILITLASMIGTLVMAVIVFVLQFIVEAKAKRQRDKDSRGRLRASSTKKVVNPDPLPHDHKFRAPLSVEPHLFLAHPPNDRVWDCRQVWDCRSQICS